jgi:hypothetical protein
MAAGSEAAGVLAEAEPWGSFSFEPQAARVSRRPTSTRLRTISVSDFDLIRFFLLHKQ